MVKSHGQGRVQLMSDYSCGMPLWGDGGLIADPVAELGISAELADDLAAWQEWWEQHFHDDRGWDSAAARTAYLREAPPLADRLQRELPGVEVVNAVTG